MREINNEIINSIGTRLCEALWIAFPPAKREDNIIAIHEIDNIIIIIGAIKMQYIDMYINSDKNNPERIEELANDIIKRAKIIMKVSGLEDWDQFIFLDRLKTDLDKFKEELKK